LLLFCENVFETGKFPVKIEHKILDIFWGELQVFYIGQEARFSLCGERDMDQLGFISFISPFLNQFWISARLVCTFCEAMAGSLSVASTAVSLAKVAVVDSGEVGRSAVYIRYNNGPRTMPWVCPH
jgi:hypothetical protein